MNDNQKEFKEWVNGYANLRYFEVDLTSYDHGKYVDIEMPDSLNYGKLQSVKPTTNFDFVGLEYTTGSDYSGSLVERSNYEVIKETFEENGWSASEGCVLFYGGYSRYGVGFYIPQMTDETIEYAKEIIESLENYMLLDEQLLSEMEDEKFKEYVKDDMRRDVIRYLDNNFPIWQMSDDEGWDRFDPSDDEHPSIVGFIHWANGKVDEPMYWVPEIGEAGYVENYDKFMKSIDKDMLLEYFKQHGEDIVFDPS